MSNPKFVFAGTLDPETLDSDGSGLFRLSTVESTWFNSNEGGNPYVKVCFNDGNFVLLDMNEKLFMKLVETIDKADLDG